MGLRYSFWQRKTIMNNAKAPNSYRLLWAGFFAIFAAGVGFAVRTGVLRLWADKYGFTMTELGEITGGGLVGFGIVILIGSLIAEHLGYGTLMIFALIMHILAAILQLCTDQIYEAFGDHGKEAVYWSLYIAMFLFSIGNGICEAVVNPVVATLFPDKKTHYLNILHAGWPGGLITGGVISYLMNGGAIGDWVPLGKVDWLWQMSMFLIPVALYGVLVLGQHFPKSEAGQAGVSYGTMLLQLLSPVFLVLLLIHALVGYVELGTDSWISKITGSILANPNYGMLLFIYTSGLMFILRFFGGPIEHMLSPLGLLCCSGILGAIGLTLLGCSRGNRALCHGGYGVCAGQNLFVADNAGCRFGTIPQRWSNHDRCAWRDGHVVGRAVRRPWNWIQAGLLCVAAVEGKARPDLRPV